MRAKKSATKTELRQEIAELRNVGAQMANICFNLAQGRQFTAYDREITDGVRQEWDAIKRREPDETASQLARLAAGHHNREMSS